jgi:hypothetical protein
MSQKEIYDFLEPYIDLYDLKLWSREGNPDSGKEYNYRFIDDLGINILINPNNKGFSFSYIVDFIFRLESDEFTPLDYTNHFDKAYLRFRKIVEKYSEEKQCNT